MKRTVWKYELSIAPVEPMMFPAGAKFLHAGPTMYSEILNVWLDVFTSAPLEPCRLFVTGTGHAVEHDWIYLATVQSPGGFVWHIWEAPR